MKRIFIAGAHGMVGSALIRHLKKEGYTDLITPSFSELDLRNQAATEKFFTIERPEYVFLAAARVGGINANATQPAPFFYDNLMIAANTMHAAHINKVKKLLYFGSSCIYPRNCPQPIREEYLLTGPLEETNQAYALAKIAGLSMAQFYMRQYGSKFISCMPTNLYGPGDTFDSQNSHVIPALIKKFIEASENHNPTVTVWGTGEARREFLHVDDLAKAALVVMERYQDMSPINIGTGKDLSISELIELIKDATNYCGTIIFDTRFPNGTPVKRLEISKIQHLGWSAKIPLKSGLEQTIAWYKKDRLKVRLEIKETTIFHP